VPSARRPRLPSLAQRKIYKTGQTRGATPAEIYQNRVGRNSTVLIPFSRWQQCQLPSGETYENGSIVLVPPEIYFTDSRTFKASRLRLGVDALVFYARRLDWIKWPPSRQGWNPATSRLAPLGGEYVARIPGTTAAAAVPSIHHGFTTTQMRGAGIRVYEYASRETIALTRLQLEALFWLCRDATRVLRAAGMDRSDITRRRKAILEQAAAGKVLDYVLLERARAMDDRHRTICPLCMELMSASTFLTRIEQAEGREVFDTTITEASMFHIDELRVGALGHRPYNLGWGHHHCNVVAKDAGIPATLTWIRKVARRNNL